METAALVISGVSLVVAVISFILSTKSQYLQDKINEIELRLKEYELAEKEKEQEKAPCVEARIINIIRNKYKIRIWNSGNSIAKNVNAFWDDLSSIVVLDKDKMPFEFLDPQKSFELTVFVYDDVPNKLCIITEWNNDNDERQSKMQWCDL